MVVKETFLIFPSPLKAFLCSGSPPRQSFIQSFSKLIQQIFSVGMPSEGQPDTGECGIRDDRQGHSPYRVPSPEQEMRKEVVLLGVISVDWEDMGSSEKDSSSTPRNQGRLPGGSGPAALWREKSM